eukprot:1988226-Rhodomonas_salina.1
MRYVVARSAKVRLSPISDITTVILALSAGLGLANAFTIPSVPSSIAAIPKGCFSRQNGLLQVCDHWLHLTTIQRTALAKSSCRNSEPSASLGLRLNGGGVDMDIAKRKTYISPSTFLPEKYLYFGTHSIPCEKEDKSLEWGLAGRTDNVHTCKKLSWGERGQFSALVRLDADFVLPAGRFSFDLELFVTSGILRIGDRCLRKHGHAFIPAGQWIGPISVLPDDDPQGPIGDLGHNGVEVLWMEQGGAGEKKFIEGERGSEEDHPDYIPASDSLLLPWGQTATAQFEVAKKKMLRKTPNGGGVWLLNIFPHYDSVNPMIQNYNEVQPPPSA